MHLETGQALLIVLAAGITALSNAAAEQVTAEDIVDNCRIRTNASDLRGHLDFTFSDGSGKSLKNRKAAYFWKDYAGSDDIWSKTILTVLAPPRVKDVGYLRYEYAAASGREPDQWIYLPDAHRVRRLVMRDPSDQSWGIVGDDLQVLQLAGGEIRLLRTEQDQRGTVYWLEVVPKSTKLPYTKVHSAFLREGDGWDHCTRRRSDFFDDDDKLIKVVKEDWGQHQQFWYRQRLVVENMKTRITEKGEVTELRTSVEYVFNDIEFNTGLNDELFTTRVLEHPGMLTRPVQ